MASHFANLNPDDKEGNRKMMRNLHGPAAVDRQIRIAINACWMELPAEQRNVENVANEIQTMIVAQLANLGRQSESPAPTPREKQDVAHCEVCGKPAQIHTCEVREGVISDHHFCPEHAKVHPEEPNAEALIRMAICVCDLVLRTSQCTLEMIGEHLRRISARAITDFREDAAAFGFDARGSGNR